MNEERRVVITGLGAVTPLGLTLDETWPRMIKGESGIGPITLFDASDLPVRIAGEVKGFDAADHLDRKMVRRTSRTSHLAAVAAQAALHDGNLDLSKIDPTSIGVYIGTGVPGFDRQIEGVTSVADGNTRVNPFSVVSSLGNMAAAVLCTQYDLQGPTATIVTACASGLQAIGEAAEMIRRGWADVMLAGGTDALILRPCFVGFDSAGALSRRSDDPAKACRPFDADRDGTVLAEGAAVLILEELSHARQRGAHIYAEVTGYAVSADAYSLFESDPTGQSAAQTMSLAIRRAGLRPSDIDFVQAHGTATRANDIAETRGIKLALGETAHTTPITSIKSMIGHTLGAAGAIATAVTIKSMHDSCLPPTINLDTPDPECDLDYVPNVARPHAVNNALINAFGFGGQNACVVVRRVET
jgi:3-oxoacyl-[acyl-carrier-protein] synthase II